MMHLQNILLYYVLTICSTFDLVLLIQNVLSVVVHYLTFHQFGKFSTGHVLVLLVIHSDFVFKTVFYCCSTLLSNQYDFFSGKQ